MGIKHHGLGEQKQGSPGVQPVVSGVDPWEAQPCGFPEPDSFLLFWMSYLKKALGSLPAKRGNGGASARTYVGYLMGLGD